MEVHNCSHPGCKKKFKSKYSLRRHMLSHLEVKKFKCDVCGKRFILKQYLKEHSYIHEGKKPYKCPFPGCKMSFRQPGKLSMHKKTYHGSEHFDDFEEFEDDRQSVCSSESSTLDVDSMMIRHPAPVFRDEEVKSQIEAATTEDALEFEASPEVEIQLNPSEQESHQVPVYEKAGSTCDETFSSDQTSNAQTMSPSSFASLIGIKEDIFSRRKRSEMLLSSTVSCKSSCIDSWSSEHVSRDAASVFTSLSNGLCRNLPLPSALSFLANPILAPQNQRSFRNGSEDLEF